MVESQQPRVSGLVARPDRELALPQGERSYIRLEASRRLADAQAASVAGAAGAAVALVALLALAGILGPVPAVLLLVALLAAASGLIISSVQSQGAAALEVMPGLIRHTSGGLRRRETIVHYDAIVAATVVQGLLGRYLSHTATLELTLACHSGPIRLRMAGLDDTATHRETLLGIAARESAAGSELAQVELVREMARAMAELLAEMRQMRQRLDRL